MLRLTFAAALLAAAFPPLPAQPVAAQVPSDVPASLFADKRSFDVLTAQVLLDRADFSPGVIDGLMGGNTARAISAYQRARGLPVNGQVDTLLLQKLRSEQSGQIFSTYSISADDVNGPFVEVPESMTGMAELERVAYERPAELIAEKLHMDEDFLRALNPGANFSAAGTTLRTVAAGENKLNGTVTRIEIDKQQESVRAYDADGRLLARYPATIGSSSFPSPSGSMEVSAVAPEATYHFDPQGRSWGPDSELTIPAGPNNPVGGIWIDLTRDGYGIHGSPDPELIGKTASHGCVRLTNWDARELAGAVEPGTSVVFL